MGIGMRVRSAARCEATQAVADWPPRTNNTEVPELWHCVCRPFQPAPHPSPPAHRPTGMSRLRWCKQNRRADEVGLPGGRRLVEMDFTDLVPLSDISGPVFLQPDASTDGTFYYNNYVR